MNKPRVNPQLQGAPGLRPTAAPTDAYVRPEMPGNAGSGLESLASGLAALNPALRGWADEARREWERDAVARAQAQVDALALPEAAKAIAEGRIEGWSNNVVRAAATNRHAVRVFEAGRAQREAEFLTRAGQAGFDVEAWITEVRSADLPNLADSPHALAGYREASEGWFRSLRSRHASETAKRLGSERVENAFAAMVNVVRTGLQNNQTPEQINEAIRAHYAGNQQVLGISPAEQDELVFRLAQTMAQEGRQSLVEALVFARRRGVDGQEIPAIAEKPVFAPRAAELRNVAEREARELGRREFLPVRADWREKAARGELDERAFGELRSRQPNLFSDAEAENLIVASRNARESRVLAAERERLRQMAEAEEQRQKDLIEEGAYALASGGRLAEVRDVTYTRANGDSAIYSRAQQRDAAVRLYLQRSANDAAANRETPEQTLAREAQWFGRNGVVNPVWRDTLTSGASSLSPANLARGGANLEPAMRAFGLYRELNARDPQVLARHMGEDDMRLFAAAETAMRYLGLNPQDALTATAAAAADPARRQFLRSPDPQLIESAGRALDGWVPRWAGGSGSAVNRGEVSAKVAEIARFVQIVGGLPGAAALEAAKEHFQRTHQLVNGRAVYTADRQMPPDFGEEATDYIRRWQRQNEAALGPGGRYYVAPVPNTASTWMIVDEAGIPVSSTIPGRLIEPATLAENKRTRIAEEAERQRVLREQRPAIDPELGPISGPAPSPLPPRPQQPTGLTRFRTPPAPENLDAARREAEADPRVQELLSRQRTR